MVVNDSHSLFKLLDKFDPYNKQHFETHDWKRAIKWDSYD